MDKLLTVIANCIFEYGRKGAGIPSQHGAYEEEVPQTLQNHDEDLKCKKRKELLRNENRNSFFMVA